MSKARQERFISGEGSPARDAGSHRVPKMGVVVQETVRTDSPGSSSSGTLHETHTEAPHEHDADTLDEQVSSADGRKGRPG